jgi:hypothetical protein
MALSRDELNRLDVIMSLANFHQVQKKRIIELNVPQVVWLTTTLAKVNRELMLTNARCAMLENRLRNAKKV